MHERNYSWIHKVDVKHDEIQQTHHEVSAQIEVEVPEILAAEIDKFIAIVSKNIETIPSGETRSDLVQHCDKLQRAVRKQIVGSPDSVRTRGRQPVVDSPW